MLHLTKNRADYVIGVGQIFMKIKIAWSFLKDKFEQKSTKMWKHC